MPSAVFNQVQMVPWPTAQRSVPATLCWLPMAELADGEGLCCDTEFFGLGFPSSLPPKASGLVLSPGRSTISKSTASTSTKSASWVWWCIIRLMI